jgi:hypothetical protein
MTKKNSKSQGTQHNVCAEDPRNRHGGDIESKAVQTDDLTVTTISETAQENASPEAVIKQPFSH